VSEKNDIVFQATDPRGQLVICTRERWYGHILSAHQFMAGQEDIVIAAISHPTYGIFADAHFPNRCIYYYRQPKPPPRYMKVVVVVQESGPFTVVTAFQTDSMKKGEVLIWTPLSAS
jgi:hypothetical protein